MLKGVRLWLPLSCIPFIAAAAAAMAACSWSGWLSVCGMGGGGAAAEGPRVLPPLGRVLGAAEAGAGLGPPVLGATRAAVGSG
ncbi:hypothetical protein V8C86DRAFT_2898618 [Haematococcus lacustris]